jgi:hypothetical protein
MTFKDTSGLKIYQMAFKRHKWSQMTPNGLKRNQIFQIKGLQIDTEIMIFL